jgi:hypothetical protein
VGAERPPGVRGAAVRGGRRAGVNPPRAWRK